MQVRVKLMGALKAGAPEGDRIELPEGASVDDALQALQIDPTRIQVAMINGKPQADRSATLSENDELTVLPPVGGG